MSSEFQNISPETEALMIEAVEASLTVEEQRERIREKLARNKDGTIKKTIRNCVTILEEDPVLSGGIAYNIMTGQKYVVKDLGWKKDVPTFTDADQSQLLLYFEDHYGVTTEKNVERAIDIVARKYQYHPICDCLNALVWDGTKRMNDCLHHFFGVETPSYPEYPYEVLRLFMMGAIHRVFHPGCKYELILCLVGGQGAGKSTFFRFMAIKDEWFSDDLKNLNDEKVYYKLMGMWIIEFSEMLATANAKSVEEIKSFISRQSDFFRLNYEKYPSHRPRQCVFGGSSNNKSFLPFDRSGNRRFLPVMINMDKAAVHILDDENVSRVYIEQLWAEAMTMYRECGCKPVLTFDKPMKDFLMDYQQEFMPEDVMLGIIQGFLDNCKTDKVCSVMLFKEALKKPYEEPTQWDIRKINEIMKSDEIQGWVPFTNPRHFENYGRQRGWERQRAADTFVQSSLSDFQELDPDGYNPFK